MPEWLGRQSNVHFVHWGFELYWPAAGSFDPKPYIYIHIHTLTRETGSLPSPPQPRRRNADIVCKELKLELRAKTKIEDETPIEGELRMKTNFGFKPR